MEMDENLGQFLPLCLERKLLTHFLLDKSLSLLKVRGQYNS